MWPVAARWRPAGVSVEVDAPLQSPIAPTIARRAGRAGGGGNDRAAGRGNKRIALSPRRPEQKALRQPR